MPPRQRISETVLITGASSGLGLETAVYLASRGFRVVAAMRDLNRRGRLDEAAARQNVSVEVLQLDVTDTAQVHRVVDRLAADDGGLFGLVNNAGVQLRGYFEDCSEAEVRAVFETNVFGAMTLSAAALPHMRKARRGRILFLSSVGGRIGSIGLTAYCASKFAIEGFAESLALEAAPLGIRVALIEPAIIATDIWSANRNIARRAQDPAGPYFQWFGEAERIADRLIANSPNKPVDVARAVYRGLTDRRPRLRYLVGRRAAVLLALRCLPFELFERVYFPLLVKYVIRPRKGPASPGLDG
jgi:NAD(P)-dependent dehydrogenase (short-subunit alcohol dehydrogenase family)